MTIFSLSCHCWRAKRQQSVPKWRVLGEWQCDFWNTKHLSYEGGCTSKRLRLCDSLVFAKKCKYNYKTIMSQLRVVNSNCQIKIQDSDSTPKAKISYKRQFEWSSGYIKWWSWISFSPTSNIIILGTGVMSTRIVCVYWSNSGDIFFLCYNDMYIYQHKNKVKNKLKKDSLG